MSKAKKGGGKKGNPDELQALDQAQLHLAQYNSCRLSLRKH